jgi:molybdate transport system regulatory protein
MKIWLISGSSAGLGKTTLSQGLAKGLPNAAYVKIGYGRRRKDGPANYFTSSDDGIKFINGLKGNHKHCIVESNRLVGKLDADVTIFLDLLNGDRRVDAFKLRKAADIVVGRDSNKLKWKSVLGKLQLPAKAVTKVLAILESQQEFLSKKKISIRTKIWFGVEGKVVFGEGLARLLQGIDLLGSLTKAAKEEGISYRHAWGDIKRSEERLGFELIDRQAGGKAGGGSQLTKEGRRLLEGYGRLKRKVIRESDRWFTEMNEEILREFNK